MESPRDILPLARELAARADKGIDTFHQMVCQLAYQGHLTAIVEMMRLAWPLVQSSSEILPWAISDFAQEGPHYEVYKYLEHAPAPDPRDPGLLDRIRFFIEDKDLDKPEQFIRDVAGLAVPGWKVDDFTLKPVNRERRDRHADRDEIGEEESTGSGAQNLSRLLCEFIGYLRRVEGVPYPKGELIRNELFKYFVRRHEGDLNPKRSMLDSMLNPKKKYRRPPKPSHPLCPERITFDAFLGRLVDFMSGLDHIATAVFELVPARLRFLESRGLIDAGQHTRTLEELRPLQTDLLKRMESYLSDPALYRALQTWPSRLGDATATAGAKE